MSWKYDCAKTNIGEVEAVTVADAMTQKARMSRTPLE
jgi:hypothetical protein